MNTFRLTIARVGEVLYDGEAASVALPGRDGRFTVLAHHEPFISELAEGVAQVIEAGGARRDIALRGSGIAEVSHNQATVIL